MQTVTLKIGGMTCGGCAKSVNRVLSETAGVQSVIVSFEQAQATIEFDESVVSLNVLKEAIEDAGFDVLA